MKEPFTILITDRNRHVREFLKREMVAEGYQVKLAKSGREIMKLVFSQGHLDLVILDLDLPDAGELDILERLQDRIPVLPVVVHTFLPEYFISSAAFVEKSGTNIDRLKEVVFDILRKSYPKRFEPWMRTEPQVGEQSGCKKR
ncbi:MAG: response regulator [Candidatus Hodarchaeota archaeon]